MSLYEKQVLLSSNTSLCEHISAFFSTPSELSPYFSASQKSTFHRIPARCRSCIGCSSGHFNHSRPPLTALIAPDAHKGFRCKLLGPQPRLFSTSRHPAHRPCSGLAVPEKPKRIGRKGSIFPRLAWKLSFQVERGPATAGVLVQNACSFCAAQETAGLKGCSTKMLWPACFAFC
jgi:hypothetical protein